MHSTRPTSNAGQLKPCTSLGASTSMATETAILTNSHNMKLTALLPGPTLESLLVMPRAIKAAGTTTVAAPYRSDQPTSCRELSRAANSAATTPTPACTRTTLQGESEGDRARSDSASSRVNVLTGGRRSSSPSCQARFVRSPPAASAGTFSEMLSRTPGACGPLRSVAILDAGTQSAKPVEYMRKPLFWRRGAPGAHECGLIAGWRNLGPARASKPP